jgi:hypothetical protein
VDKWDVMNASHVHSYGRVSIESVVKERERGEVAAAAGGDHSTQSTLLRRVWIPSWFSVDIKCGVGLHFRRINKNK